MIKTLKKRGVYHKDIARELGVHPRTVSRALQRGSAPTAERQPRSSKLDPYKPQIDRLLAEGVWNAVVILRELQGQGYDGGSTILRAYIHPKRSQRRSQATVRFETPPGRQLQTDWGETTTCIAGEAVKVSFIVNTLGYSRRFHFWCSDCQDAEHTYEGLIRSFEYFGGVTEEVLVDNQKAAVLEHRAGTAVQFNPRFVDLAGNYGFVPRACQPYRARTKGKDERMVGYVKQHFFVRYRAFESWAHLNQLAEQWLREEADARRHGTVKEVVAERFVREAPYLQPLPVVRYDTAYHEHRRVAWDGYIDVCGNRYSVPSQWVGQTVADLESAIFQVQSDLFGENRIYLDIKKKIGKQGGLRNIPDGYLIDLDGRKPRLYVVENELASHDPLRHVAVQLLEFSLSFGSERRKIKSIIFEALQNYPAAKTFCEEYAESHNYRNLDHMLEEMVFDAPFAALVIIDEMSDELQTVLAEKFKFGVEVLQISRYANSDGELLYQFKPFLAGIRQDLSASNDGTATTRTLDVEEVDTIVVPAQSEGFQETFLGENRWHAIRIHGTMRPQIKHIAAYQVRPISAITHVAPVSSIEPWGDTGKFVVNFSEPAEEIGPIELVPNSRVKALQNIRYTTLERLKSARTLDDVW